VTVTPLVAALLFYSAALVGLGIWIGRRVRSSTAFFVADRSLGTGLLFATFLAANIGYGATVTATGYAYTDGLAAWWWNGSAGLGSFVLAFWVGPRMWREAREKGFLTVGDFLEHRFGGGVRILAVTLIWLGSLLILCAQIRGAADVLSYDTGLAPSVSVLVASAAAVGYFVTGGLSAAAWVNVVQLIVILAGFALAAPLATRATGGPGLASVDNGFWSGAHVGWHSLFLLGPAFFLSPGLIQKSFGARDVGTLTRGVAWNGVALLAFACLPVLLGLSARAVAPGLERPETALMAVLDAVPAVVRSVALAAIFSAAISSADAVLFMLSTSGARDVYRGLFRPRAADAEMLRAARLVALGASVAGYFLTFAFDSVVGALTMFYSLMVVTLFAPILGGLYLPRAGRWGAAAAMLVGVATLVTTHAATGGAGYGWAAPHFLGLMAGGLTYLVLAVF
jgi:SSS family solute:Na+ symporter